MKFKYLYFIGGILAFKFFSCTTTQSNYSLIKSKNNYFENSYNYSNFKWINDTYREYLKSIKNREQIINYYQTKGFFAPIVTENWDTLFTSLVDTLIIYNAKFSNQNYDTLRVEYIKNISNYLNFTDKYNIKNFNQSKIALEQVMQLLLGVDINANIFLLENDHSHSGIYRNLYNFTPHLIISKLNTTNFLDSCCDDINSNIKHLIKKEFNNLSNTYNNYFNKDYNIELKIENFNENFHVYIDTAEQNLKVELSNKIILALFLKNASEFYQFILAYNHNKVNSGINYFNSSFGIPESLWPNFMSIDKINGLLHNEYEYKYVIDEKVVAKSFLTKFLNDINFLIAHELAHIYIGSYENPLEEELFCDCVAFKILNQNQQVITKDLNNIYSFGGFDLFFMYDELDYSKNYNYNPKISKIRRYFRSYILSNYITINNRYNNIISIKPIECDHIIREFNQTHKFEN
jgi:hypothetical protein